MDIENFREYCISLGDVDEKMPFGKFARRYDSILAFYVAGHMFCFIDIEDFSWVNIRSTPERITEIRDTFNSVGNPMNQSLKYWIRLDFGGDIPDKEIYQFISEAFSVVKQKYTRK